MNRDVYLIAEAGVNHEGDLQYAIKMIEEAAKAGADAIKFQTYKAEKIASKHSPSYWDLTKESATSQYDLFKRYDRFGEEEYKILAKECKKWGINFLSTPFDFDSAEYLAPLMDRFKISSSDLTNTPFLKYIASFNKPIILSVGAATYSEIVRAVEVLEECNCNDLTLLHCVLSYPTKNEDANLQFIKKLREMFPQYKIGYSDHTLPDERMIILTTAVMLGATVIEKHFTLDKSRPGNDHYHAMDPHDIRVFRENVQLINTLIGTDLSRPLACEKDSRRFARRSIVATRAIKAGEVISEKDITFKRPGTGIPPYELELVLGRTAKVDIHEDTILTWEMI